MLKSDLIAEVVNCYPVLSDLPPALKLAFVNSSTAFYADLDAVLYDFSPLDQPFVMLTSGTIRVGRQGKGREIVLYRLIRGNLAF